MKNISLILLLTAVVVSCKKERTCSCAITTSGNVTSRAQSAGLSFTFSIPGFPVTIPPVTIIASKDTSIVTPYSFASSSKESYDKISKRSLKGTCPTSTEETISNSFTELVPGSHTVTSTNVGTRKGTCKIE